MKAGFKIKELLEEGVINSVYPGASLLISKEEDVLFCGEVGSAELEPTRRPVTSETLWDIASLTKPIATASLVLLLSQEEGIDLRQEKVGERFSLFDLLHHISGLPAWVDCQLPLTLALSHEGRGEKTSSIIRNEILNTPLGPQGKTIYSDLGYILLGLWLEEKTGKTLSRLFDERIAGPLKLVHTLYCPLERGISKDSIAATHRSERRGGILVGEVDDDNAALLGGIAGHAGLFSTVGDIHLFLSEIQHALKGNGRIFKRETLLPLLDSRPPDGRFHLGFDTPSPVASQAGTHFSRASIGHLGFSGCSFWLDLKSGWEIVFFTNRVHPDPSNEKIKRFRPTLHDRVAEIFETK